MAIKILVVDDSATMRKILEMTFAGEDAQVVTADNAPAALAKAGDFRPNVILADTSMKPDGYELAQALRGQPTLAGTPLIVLASQQNPYDASRGTSSGVDDHIVKPFDTQALIDKVKAVVARGRAGAPAPSASGIPAPTPIAAPVPAAAAPAPRPPVPPVGAPAAPPRDLKRTMAFGTPLAPIANPVGPVQRSTESVVGPLPSAPMPASARPQLELDDEPIELRQAVVKPSVSSTAIPVAPRPPAPVAPPPVIAAPPAPAAPPPVAPAPRPPVAPPLVAAPPPPVASPAPTPSPAPAAPAPRIAAPETKVAAATSQNGALAGKLANLGLDANQVAGVLALSREVIEQVVWEVVPDLAETIIREELKRLTAE